MFLNILKHDIFEGMKRHIYLYLTLFSTVLLIMLLNRLGAEFLNTIGNVMVLLIFILFITAYTVINLKFYYAELIGRQSYFNFTIPISESKMIFSKIFSIIFWGIISFFVFFLFFNVVTYITRGNLVAYIINTIDNFSDFKNFTIQIIGIVFCLYLLFVSIIAFSIELISLPVLKNKNISLQVSIASSIFLPQIFLTVLTIIWYGFAARGFWDYSFSSFSTFFIINLTFISLTFLLIDIFALSKYRSL